jgi:hypothetical protein
MRTVTVSLRALQRALKAAKSSSDDWQAECCEIALIPAVAKRWAELNADRFQNVHLDRYEGKPHIGMLPDGNRAVADWSEYAGYVLHYSADPSISNWGWNSVRQEYYGHSPSTAWDGMRRETISQFIHDLRMVALGYDHPEINRSIDRAKIRVKANVRVPQIVRV